MTYMTPIDGIVVGVFMTLAILLAAHFIILAAKKALAVAQDLINGLREISSLVDEAKAVRSQLEIIASFLGQQPAYEVHSGPVPINAGNVEAVERHGGGLPPFPSPNFERFSQQVPVAVEENPEEGTSVTFQGDEEMAELERIESLRQSGMSIEAEEAEGELHPGRTVEA